jgi:hypothetical protein
MARAPLRRCPGSLEHGCPCRCPDVRSQRRVGRSAHPYPTERDGRSHRAEGLRRSGSWLGRCSQARSRRALRRESIGPPGSRVGGSTRLACAEGFRRSSPGSRTRAGSQRLRIAPVSTAPRLSPSRARPLRERRAPSWLSHRPPKREAAWSPGSVDLRCSATASARWRLCRPTYPRTTH